MKEPWEIWLTNRKAAERTIQAYIRRGVIREGATKIETQGHMHKAKRNLHFSRRVVDELKDFYEWAIVSYYYSVYQAALALCASRGYTTKSHTATIALLITLFYPNHLTRGEIHHIANGIGEEDIRELVELKKYREDATYSISVEYEQKLAERLGETAIEFVNKIEQILKE